MNKVNGEFTISFRCEPNLDTSENQVALASGFAAAHNK